MLRNARFFSSLQHRDFRLLWSDMVLSSICTSTEDVLLAWLVMELASSSWLFGVVMSLRFAPRIIGPMSGLLADRVDRRKLLIVFKAVQIAVSVVLGSLLIFGQIQLWHIVVIILVQNTVLTFNMPAQTAITVDVVGTENITNAAALERLSYTVSGLFGQSLVGAFVNQIGVGTFYYLNAAIYAASLVSLCMIRKAPSTLTMSRERALSGMVEGFRYSLKNKPVLTGQIIVFTTNLFPIACGRTLMWIYAKNVLNLDASGLGWLSAGSTLGSFAASAIIAQLGNIEGKGKIVAISGVMWGVGWLLFSMSNSFALAVISLIITSISSIFTLMLAEVILMVYSEPNMRGRVTGFRQLAISSQFPGSIIAGAMAETLGNPAAVGLEGAFFIVTMLATMKLIPSLLKTK